LLKDFESTEVADMREEMRKLNEKHRKELADIKASTRAERKAREQYEKQCAADIAQASKAAEIQQEAIREGARAASELQQLLELERQMKGGGRNPGGDIRRERQQQERVGTGWFEDQGDPEAIRHQMVLQQAEAQLAAARLAASAYTSSQPSAGQTGHWTPGKSDYAAPYQQAMPYSPAQQQMGMYSPAQQTMGMYSPGQQQLTRFTGQQQVYSPAAQYQGTQYEFINQGPGHYQQLQEMISREKLDHEVQKARAAEREIAAQANRNAAESAARQQAHQERINSLDSMMRAQGYTGPRQ
jgi:hypothetical protein